jgi:hypothetical protein
MHSDMIIKKNIFTIISICLVIISQAQSPVKFNQVIRVDTALITSNTVALNALSDSDFMITNTEWVDNIMKDFTYWDEMYDDGFTTTLLINEKSKPDSIMVVESKLDKYVFIKQNAQWYIQNFSIKSTNLTLNHVAVGLTSKEVFKLLGKKIKKPVGNGQIWVSNKSGKTRLIFTFVNDKMIEMRY